ncbi:MAG: carbohydrate binding domain-containing protein, partial [Acidimicrobiia bacterium]|nr:carbohydrate binding domain-containing protein [Acidimicrobiia bacterium]
MAKSKNRRGLQILVLAIAMLALPAISGGPALAAPPEIIDDFENGLPSGADGDGVPVGFMTFSDGSDVSIATTDAPPESVPDSAPGNNVMALTTDASAFAGFTHAFENSGADAWVPQNWSTRVGISLWFYGQNTGTSLFVDVLDNRNPGSTSDDAERFVSNFTDDFTGWQLLEFPFSGFVRKDIGNGAPNDGFTLTEVHGWALGTLATSVQNTFYVDNAALYGVAEIPELAVTFAAANTDIEEGQTGEILVKLNREMNEGDPAQVSVDFLTETVLAVPGRDFIPTTGTLTFDNGGNSELSFELETLDDTKWEGAERVILRLTNPVDVAPGFAMQAAATIVDNEEYEPYLLDDFEQGAYLWSGEGPVEFDAVEVESVDPDARPGQDPVESVLGPGPGLDTVKEGVIADLEALLPASTRWRTRLIEAAIARIERSLNSDYWTNGFVLDPNKGWRVFSSERWAVFSLGYVRGPEQAAAEAAIEELVAADARLAELALEVAVRNDGSAASIARAERQIEKAEADLARGKPALAVTHYKWAWKWATKAIRNMTDLDFGSIGRDFAMGQDWSSAESLDFWFYGTGSGETVTVNLKDNRAPDPGPDGWELVWSEEYDDPAGTPPNPDYWSYEIGDGTVNGIPGWGNDEFQYYTDDPANAATDGLGNMVLTISEVEDGDESLLCYYGPCDYTSARLVSSRKAEFAYGRIESRIKVPEGEAGLWPAFWSLGTDIDVVGWPQTGEIDFMEYVSRLPLEIFGTIHGPGYAGGQSYGSGPVFVSDPPVPVYEDYHTFAIEWQPDLIEWYLDGHLYHTATPELVEDACRDPRGCPWVFNDPVFLIYNVAIGGNFGGTIDPNLQLPQSMAIDYVRVYQGPDTAERWETTFVDDTAGWQEVTVPLTDFDRSADQPAGAPDDGLDLDEVWGYGFDLPYPAAGAYMFDQVRLIDTTPPTVGITDDVPEDEATGDVTFTFTFSEPVIGFTDDDIELEGGTKGTFTVVDAKHATLVARPPVDTEDRLVVTVAPGTFEDRAGLPNLIGASAEQAYNTPPISDAPVVIDDFEDGVVSDWGYFGGNDAGGGYGVGTDRPQEGAFYLSTGWGGKGSASGFYGGLFKNLANDAQVAPPLDPWFNVWVLNQSDATVDQYTLEVTIREDLDGNGWSGGGVEESFRLDTVYASSSFDDTWTLLSAPLSGFTRVDGVGDGTFNGNLDEIVVVVSGVQGSGGEVGEDPTTVEVDFDYFTFTSGGPPGIKVIDDFEDGVVSDWGYFGGNDAGGGYGVGTDRPQEGAFYLSTGWG